MATQPSGRIRLAVRVYPASKRPHVGGRYGDTEPPVLVVRVQAPAADGKANDAVTAALAAALDVPRSSVRIIVGASSRMKTVEVDGASAVDVRALLERD